MSEDLLRHLYDLADSNANSVAEVEYFVLTTIHQVADSPYVRLFKVA